MMPDPVAWEKAWSSFRKELARMYAEKQATCNHDMGWNWFEGYDDDFFRVCEKCGYMGFCKDPT